MIKDTENIVREFVRALVKREKDRAVSFFTEDVVWLTPNGKFAGKDEIRHYIEWMNSSITDLNITSTGIGLMVKDNIGVYEHIIGGNSKGRRWDALAMCVYELEGTKIRNIAMVYDRLDVARQVTTGLAKTAVNNVVREMEKGLH
jgi:ketosteroid isomerase-like protein